MFKLIYLALCLVVVVGGFAACDDDATVTDMSGSVIDAGVIDASND